MKNINVVCVYNNQKLYDGMVASFEKTVPENLEYACIPLDNTKNEFKSAAKAYNYAVENLCDAEVIIFCHQDIVFYEGAVEKIYKYCLEDKNCLFGAAGVEYPNKGIVSGMRQNQYESKYDSMNGNDTVDVFTLDECLIAASADLFKKVKFDEKLCDGWHLYAVDYSIQCHVDNIRVAVIDLDILHLSGGNVDKVFYKFERLLGIKYRKHFKKLYFTWGWTYTNPILSTAQYLYRRIRY